MNVKEEMAAWWKSSDLGALGTSVLQQLVRTAGINKLVAADIDEVRGKEIVDNKNIKFVSKDDPKWDNNFNDEQPEYNEFVNIQTPEQLAKNKKECYEFMKKSLEEFDKKHQKFY